MNRFIKPRFLFSIILCFSFPALTKAADVFIFFESKCSICKYYLPSLLELANQNKDIEFHFIYPAKYKNNREISQFKKLIPKKSNIKTLIDINNEKVIEYQAKVTPEVIVFDNQNKEIYRGLIDDKYISIGNYKQKTERFYLQEALNFLNGKQKSLEFRKTEAVGCFILE